MRYVVDAPMVAHLWAHQSQDSARSGGNFISRARTFILMDHISGVRPSKRTGRAKKPIW